MSLRHKNNRYLSDNPFSFKPYEDKNRNEFITKKSSREYIIDGRALVRDVNRKLGTSFKTDSANTIAGLIINQLEKIPDISEEVLFLALT